MIFGTGSAKFSRSGSDVLLQNSILEPNYITRNVITTTSIHDHYNTYNFLGDYSDFNVKINLWQYDDATIKYNEIYPYLYSYVYFWPHEDGNAITGSDGNPALFFIDKISHEYNTSIDVDKDIIKIHFKSVGYTNITGSLI